MMQLQLLLQMIHLGVLVGVLLRFAQPDPVDDARVDQTIGDLAQLLEDPA